MCIDPDLGIFTPDTEPSLFKPGSKSLPKTITSTSPVFCKFHSVNLR